MSAPRKDRELFLKLAPRLKALITFHRTPYAELAGLLDCSQAFISYLCRGRKLLPADKLPRLAKFYNLTCDQLLGKDSINEIKHLDLP